MSELRHCVAEEVDRDGMSMAIAERLLSHGIGYWFMTDGKSVFVKCYRDRSQNEEITVTLDNVDEIIKHRQAIRAKSGVVSQEEK